MTKVQTKEVITGHRIGTALAAGEQEGGMYLFIESNVALDVAYLFEDAAELNELITDLQDRYAELVRKNMEKPV